MAHIEKRAEGRWRARYRDPAGKERSRTFARKADAEKFLTGIESAKLSGSFVDPAAGKATFADYSVEWLATKADVAPRTLVNIEGRLRNHAVPFFGAMPLASIEPRHVRAWVAQMVADGMAPSTVKATYLTASQVFAQAAVDRIIASSPCIGVKLPSERPRESMVFLDAGQVNELAAAIDERYRTAIYLAAYGGLRAGELWALRTSRVDPLTGTLEVVESASEVGGRWTIGPTKTGRPRSIQLPRFLAQMIGEQIGRWSSDEGYVFTAAQGGPVRHRNFYRRHFLPAARRAGMPEGLRWHDLRHTCAALLIANGRHLEEVKVYLGHSSIRVTSDRYGHLFPEARAELAAGLDATFAEAPAASPRPEQVIALPRDAQRDAV